LPPAQREESTKNSWPFLASKSGQLGKKYSDCLFAYNTISGELYAFDPAFQQDAFHRYLKRNGIDESDVAETLSRTVSTAEEERVLRICSLLSVFTENSEIEFAPISPGKSMIDYSQFLGLFSDLGYRVHFLEVSGKDRGIYYIGRKNNKNGG
jgi:hypothetical protein